MKNMLSVAALLSLLTPFAGGDEIKTYDHRADAADDGYYLLFCSRPDAEGSAGGDAVVVLAQGDAPADCAPHAAFGLYVDDDKAAVGAIDHDYIEALRDTAETKTLAVRLDEEQYGLAKSLIDEWAARDDFVDAPDIVALNFCETLILRLKLKKPFRPVLSPANPHVYFDDLAKLNRNPKHSESF